MMLEINRSFSRKNLEILPHNFQIPRASRYVRPIGRHIAEMLTNLTASGMDPKTLELSGASLGAHCIGFIAKNFYRLTGKKVGRLVGLDPSGPCFRNNPAEDRMDRNDADFVLSIHTNIDGFGMAAPLGHVAFYVNGGEYQPGDIYWMPCSIMCSHRRGGVIWFVAMQHPNTFIGLKCDSVQQARRHQCYDRVPRETNVLGFNTNSSKPGIYYLATENNYPYYLGDKGLEKENEFFTKSASEINRIDIMTA